jgi:hypothetical protein
VNRLKIACKARKMSGVVLSHPAFQVVGVPGIEPTTTAVKHVGPERHRVGLRERQPFDKLGANE